MNTAVLLIRIVTRPVESTLLQVPRALVASCLAAGLDIGLLVALVETGGWSALPAATVSYLVGGILQYYLCSVWVFPNAPRSATTGFASFTLLSLIGLGITWLTLAVVHDLAGVNYAAAKVLALGLAFCWNFLSRKFLIFQAAD